ncbi:hypothetical protein NQZ68_018962 [Dissostichus eleginoides]|nr:hypothetical protein NQZ68_018962 [Dissostichus eleginoides]
MRVSGQLSNLISAEEGETGIHSQEPVVCMKLCGGRCPGSGIVMDGIGCQSLGSLVASGTEVTLLNTDPPRLSPNTTAHFKVNCLCGALLWSQVRGHAAQGQAEKGPSGSHPHAIMALAEPMALILIFCGHPGHREAKVLVTNPWKGIKTEAESLFTATTYYLQHRIFSDLMPSDKMTKRSPPHVPRLFHVNEWGQYRHINIILCSLPPRSEWMLSAGAYLRRDGKGTEERKSILYLTTKHNPNQKQLEFAGCSINWTASSGWPLCRWIATVMHYSTMA